MQKNKKEMPVVPSILHTVASEHLQNTVSGELEMDDPEHTIAMEMFEPPNENS